MIEVALFFSEGFGYGLRYGARTLIEGRFLEHSHRPFQMMVRALPTISAYSARVAVPMSSPINSAGVSVTLTFLAFAPSLRVRPRLCDQRAIAD
jgi:hypothetical protein